jgi:hypothetical protein
MEIMDLIVTVIVVGFVGWLTLEWLLPKKSKEEPEETKIEPAKKIETDFVTGLTVDKAKEDIKDNIDAKTEEVFVKVMEQAAKVEKPVEEVLKEVVATVEPVVEEVKVATKKVRAKAKAIEEAIEEKTEQLEAAVKKTRAKAKKNG